MGANESEYRAALRSPSAVERKATLDSAKRALEQARERELARLKREIGACEVGHAKALEALEHDAEASRRERARMLLAEVFDSLPTLLATWRRDPNRQATAELQARWREWSRRAETELGEPLSAHLLGTAIAGLLTEELGGMSLLCGFVTGWTVDPRMVESLAAWERAVDPAAGLEALERIESACVTLARRGARSPVEERHRELHTAYRSAATRLDLARLVAEHDEKWRRRDAASFEASYIPPKPLGERVMEWLRLDSGA